MPQFTASRARPDAFDLDDIQIGADFLQIDLDLEISGEEYRYLLLKQRDEYKPDKSGSVRQDTFETPDREELSPDLDAEAKALKTGKSQPVAVYFSTRRSLVSDEQPRSGRASGGQAAAYADALSERPLRLAEFASWMRAQEELSSELPRASLHLDALQEAASRFLPDCSGLRAEVDDRPRLLIDKQGTTLDVRQLSDGERSMLALVLDLARRLSQANPELEDPIRDGKGVVLIDELDLHLHPTWQRKVVGQLLGTFPACQFIATTHSPQIIGEVPHEKIRIIREGEVFTPEYSFGIDSSRVLEELMETAPRNTNVEEQIGTIARLIADGMREEANAAIDALSLEIGEDDPEITRARTLLDFMEDEV